MKFLNCLGKKKKKGKERERERKEEEEKKKVMLNKAQLFHNVFTNFRVLLLPKIPCRLANGKEKPRSTMLCSKRT